MAAARYVLRVVDSTMSSGARKSRAGDKSSLASSLPDTYEATTLEATMCRRSGSLGRWSSLLSLSSTSEWNDRAGLLGVLFVPPTSNASVEAIHPSPNRVLWRLESRQIESLR
jgi:hypothetical protein